MKADLEAAKKEVAMFEKQYEKIADQPTGDTVEGNQTTEELKIPFQKEPDNLLKNVQIMADEANVTIQLLQTVDTSNEEGNQLPSGVGSTTFSLEAESNQLDQMNAFLTAIKGSKRLITINTLNLDKNANGVYLIVTLTTYYVEE